MSFDYKPIGYGATVYSGFAFRSSDLINEGIPVIKIGNIQNKTVDYSSSQFFLEEKITEKHKKFLLEDKDVLIAMTGQGSVGRVGRIRLPISKKILLNQRVGKFVTDDTKLNKEYLYYVISSAPYEEMLFNAGSGSGQPNLSPNTILSLEIPYPTIPEQETIAATLSCLDDKIELNNHIIANLEAQAQAIFKSWFVDFEPFQDGEFEDSELGMIPKGWRVSNLLEIANYLNGLAMQNFRPEVNDEGLPVLKIKELRQGFCDDSSDRCTSKLESKYIVHDGDVIFSWSGSLLIDLWCSGDCGLNQHLFKVTSKEYQKWFYYMWTKHHLDVFVSLAADKATTMGHIKREALENALIVIPNAHVIKEANAIFEPLIDSIILKRIENRKIALVRDTLLPKLMSGEIEVPVEG